MTSAQSPEYGRLNPMSDLMITSLETLVRCESPTEDLSACREVVEVASAIAAEVLGTPAQIREIEGRPVFWWGDAKPEIVLLAHLDTVWPKGSYQPLFEINGDVIRGPGTFDMKVGFLQALFALKGIEGSVALIATTDEETGSHASRNLIKELSQNARAVLVLEASLDGKVKTGRKGTSMYQIKVHGRAAHAGLEPENGINSTVEISHIVLQMAALENSEHGTTVVPTMLSAGTTTNSVPDLAVLDIDARSYSTAELLRVDAAIKSLQPNNPAARIEVIGGLNRPPLEPAATKALYERAEKVAATIGIPALGHASVGGASDGNFAAAAGAQVLDGLGAVGGGAHALTEWASVSTMHQRTDFLHAFIKDLLND
jgi:glutamate carboxypeptidase